MGSNIYARKNLYLSLQNTFEPIVLQVQLYRFPSRNKTEPIYLPKFKMTGKQYKLSLSNSKKPEETPRQSSKVSSTTSRHPSMVVPPIDSRQSISQSILPGKQTQGSLVGEADAKDSENQKKKQKNNQETSKKKNKKTQKNKTKPDQPNNIDSGSIINLREDSDAENAKINIRKKYQ